MRHEESIGYVPARVEYVFAHADDPASLSSHMNESSWMTAGSRMRTELDARHGQSVGSKIRLEGRVLGLPVHLDEVITDRQPPLSKVWETVGAVRLFVLGTYRMGFELQPWGMGTRMRVYIDYALPDGRAWRWLGRLAGRWYARWCTQRMVADTIAYFRAPSPELAAT